MAGRWIIPQNGLPATQCVLVLLPNDTEYRAILRGLVLPLLRPDSWEQTTSDVTPEEIAGVWADFLNFWDSGQICE